MRGRKRCVVVQWGEKLPVFLEVRRRAEDQRRYKA